MRDLRFKLKPLGRSGRQLLEQWIVRQRMTQAEAAELIGIDRTKLNKYLTGTIIPSLETAIRVEDATGIGMRTWLIKESHKDQAATQQVNGGHNPVWDDAAGR